MSRIHGRKGRVYLDVAGGGEASPLPFIANWTISHATDKQEVTAMEDDNKVYVSGMPDASGTFEGSYDDATAQTYTAATDGIARKFYLYPDRTVTTKYWYGTILPDFSVSAGVGSAASISCSWNAASPVLRKVT